MLGRAQMQPMVFNFKHPASQHRCAVVPTVLADMHVAYMHSTRFSPSQQLSQPTSARVGKHGDSGRVAAQEAC